MSTIYLIRIIIFRSRIFINCDTIIKYKDFIVKNIIINYVKINSNEIKAHLIYIKYYFLIFNAKE